MDDCRLFSFGIVKNYDIMIDLKIFKRMLREVFMILIVIIDNKF